MIAPLIIDRCADAFDCLLRDDKIGYMTHMGTAITMLGYPGNIPDSDRPTAVDKVKTICIHSCADKWHCSFKQAQKRLTEMLK
jgi:hypothetical protein